MLNTGYTIVLNRVKQILIGDPLSSEMMEHEHIPKWKALAVLSSDALSSVAYATEEILIPLSLFATSAMAWSIPIACSVAILLFLITISYRQTIDAYPNGGGAYTVAKENLGINAGLMAGASLLIDYTLTVAVSISAGVENIASAFPFIAQHNVMVCIIIISFITIMNLRGIRESSNIFALPTYLFIASFIVMIGVGFYQYLTGQIPNPAPIIHETYPVIPIFLLMRAFSSGCAALTGVEAISNGIPIFKKPAQKNAKITMLWMCIILGALFLSITLLAHIYHIHPHHGQTAISLLARSVFGNTWFYYVIQSSVALILLLAANTSYADFPRLSSMLAQDNFLPKQLGALGGRLVFSNGILGLSVAASMLIFFFGGRTHYLIPLYAVGVFLSFSLSQGGMIVHHLKEKGKSWKSGLFTNTIGLLATFTVLIIIAVTKFMGGAWIVIILIPSFVFLFKGIHHHYKDIKTQLAYKNLNQPIDFTSNKYTVIVPVSGIHPGVIEALKYAKALSDDVHACYVNTSEESTTQMRTQWEKVAPGIELVILQSPYRSLIRHIVQYIDDVASKMPIRHRIAVVIPEFVPSKWYHLFLHNQTSFILRSRLRLERGKFITVVRYYLE